MALSAVGLNVLGTICDGASENQSLINAVRDKALSAKSGTHVMKPPADESPVILAVNYVHCMKCAQRFHG